MRACSKCAALFTGKRPLCPECMSARYRTRSATRRANGEHSYDDDAWRKQRTRMLATDPPCEDCGAPATDLDHVPPRRLLIAADTSNVDDPIWLHPRCKACHSWRTMHVDLPLLRRLDAGENAEQLCSDAMVDTRTRRSVRHAE